MRKRGQKWVVVVMQRIFTTLSIVKMKKDERLAFSMDKIVLKK